MRIVFMGTPDFAAASMKKLIDEKRDVVGVFTQPDKPKGRGMELAASPVKVLALENGIPVYQPVKMRDGTALEMIKALEPDILVVVAYGRILPDDILAVPEYGAINVHGSLLPKYRGAAPIQWSVLNGDKITGVTTMYLAHDMDAGDVIYKAETEIGEYETAGELFDRLMDMGAELLIKTLDDIESGTAPRTPQDHSQATYVGMLDKSICPIDWNNTPAWCSSTYMGFSRGRWRRWSWTARCTACSARNTPITNAPRSREWSLEPIKTALRSPARTGRPY